MGRGERRSDSHGGGGGGACGLLSGPSDCGQVAVEDSGDIRGTPGLAPVADWPW